MDVSDKYGEKERVFDSVIRDHMDFETVRLRKEYGHWGTKDLVSRFAGGSEGCLHSITIDKTADSAGRGVTVSYHERMDKLKIEFGNSVEKLPADDLLNNIDSVKEKISKALEFEISKIECS